jgi:dienelactone hydrolase
LPDEDQRDVSHRGRAAMRMRYAGIALSLQIATAAGGQVAAPSYVYTPVPLNARIVQRTDTATFLREKVVFDGLPGVRVPALVAIPKSGPTRRPVVVLVDGIGGWKERWWSETSWNRGRILVDSLLSAGFAVAMADAPASGERTFENDFVSAESFVRDTAKWDVMGFANIMETMRLVDYLVSRADIDSTRIGMLGLSHGGMVTFAVTANNRRIKAAVAGLTPMHRIPVALLPTRHVARVTAPLLMFAATNDAWYTREQVDRAFAGIAATQKQLVWYEGGHRPPPEYAVAAVQWFRQHIGAQK